MNIKRNVPLSQHSTMRLGGLATCLTDVNTKEELLEALKWVEEQKLPTIMIGAGSNIIWRDQGFPGLVMVNKIQGFEAKQQNDGSYLVTVGGGEDWDSVVERCVEMGLSGIESLSLIPGTAGATPVQNVGAYGQEISQTLVSVEAYDRQETKFVSIPNEQCQFGYRTSRFKLADRGRFCIVGIVLRLMHDNPRPPFYAALQSYLDEQEIHEYTPKIIRECVMSIRQSKLPDPKMIANNGSFFANPIVSQELLTQLQTSYPSIPHWPTQDGRVKIPAAWLVERVGFKGVHDAETGMATWPAQPLVLVNEHAKTTHDLLLFKQKILTAVKNNFRITLEQEPELLP